MAGAISVLVVGGDPTARLGLEQVLRREQFAPIAVSTVADAMSHLAGISILLIDLMPSDSLGSSLLAHVTAQRLPIRLGIISSIPRADPTLAGLKIDAFFEKPITRDKLDALIAWLKALPPIAPAP